MKPCRFSRAVWVSALFCAIFFSLAPFGRGQTSAWDNGVSKDLFKDDQTPIDPKYPKRPQKPIRRLAPTECDDCQKIVDQLQAALDDWFALELADANDTISKSVTGKPTAVSQTDARAQKEDALTGLGQKERPPSKGKTKADVKKDIKKFSDALQECLKKCAPTPTPTPTATPKDGPTDDGGGKNGNPAPPAFDFTIPALPPCFDSEQDRQNHRDKIEKLQQKLTGLKKSNGPQLAEPPDDAWKEFKEKLEKGFQDINDQIFPGADGKDKLEKVPICKPPPGGKGTGPGKKKGKAPRVTTGHNISYDGGPEETFCALISEHKINIDISGTNETIGHVVDVVIENLTDQPIECTIPPMILESGSGKDQNYGCPESEEVALKPHDSKKIPINGVCLNRNKPPVGKGVHDALMINDGGNDCGEDRHFDPTNADKLLRICKAKYDAVDKLEKDGAFKDFPYHDKKKQKDICLQWSMWSDPRVCEITGAPPATKEAFKENIHKQLKEHGQVTPEMEKKIDKGADTMWDGIELTGEKAKDLEEPDEENGDGSTTEETPPVGQPEYVGQTRAKKPTPTPTPKPKSGGTKTKPTPTPTPAPKPKKEEPKGGTTEEKPKEPENPPTTEEVPVTPEPPLPMPSYPFTKETDCGTITISIGEKGELVFDFKKNDKCPCKKFGWIQHFSNADNNSWYYDNGTDMKGSEKTGAKSYPDNAKQPTTAPKGNKPWPENPWYGGTTDPKAPKDFDKNPKPQEHVSDTPSHPNTKFRMQLVCVDTGQVIFTWAWGPVRTGKEALDKVGAKEIPPP